MTDNRKDKALKILKILEKKFKNDPDTALDFKTPLDLLMATMLSAQCTDVRVNQTTPALFKKFKTAKAYANTDIDEFKEYIQSINFFNNKAKSMKNCAVMLVDDFKGKVPENLDDLVKLPGIGRKTANIVLAQAFGQEALAVDTHVKRVSQRLGLTFLDNPDKIEADLTSYLPQKWWTKATKYLILHGRATCKAKKPACDDCTVSSLCDFYTKSD